MVNLLLIDYTLETFIKTALNSNTEYLVFSYDDTSDDLIAKLGSIEYERIGLMQHNRNLPYYQLTKFIVGHLKNVVEEDPNLTSWSNFKNVLTHMVNVNKIGNLDLMACSIYSNPDWKYINDKLALEYGININSSLDDTGYLGNWFLEAGSVNLKVFYFTDVIDTFTDTLHSNSAYDTLKNMPNKIPPSTLIPVANSGYTTGSNISNVVGIYNNSATAANYVILQSDGTATTYGSFTTVITNVKSVYPNINDFYAVIKNDGSVFSWGNGVGNVGAPFSSVATSLNGTIPAVKIYVTYGIFAALLSNGSVVSWGVGSGASTSAITSSINGSSTKVVDIISSSSALCALLDNGTVVSWGDGQGGGTGGPSAGDGLSTIAAQVNGSNGKVIKVVGTYSSFMALKNNGTVACWGYAATNTFFSTITTAVDIEATAASFLILLSSGQVLHYNQSGTAVSTAFHTALDGTGTNKAQFLLANSVTGFAIKQNGDIVGRSGDGGTAFYETYGATLPSGVNGGSNPIKKLYPSPYIILGLRNDNTVIVWGDGQGATNLTPAALIGVTDITNVTYNEQYITAVRSNGTAVTINRTGTTAVANQTGIFYVFPTAYQMWFLTNATVTQTDVANFNTFQNHKSLSFRTPGAYSLTGTALTMINSALSASSTYKVIVPSLTGIVSVSTDNTNGTKGFIIPSNDNETITLNGSTYVTVAPYVYSVVSGVKTKVSTLTIDGIIFNIYAGSIIGDANATIVCMHPNTLINTLDGLKQISNITTLDYVESNYKSEKKFLKVLSNVKSGRTDKFIKIHKNAFGEFPSEDILLTGSHPIILNGKEYLPSKLVNGESITVEYLDDPINVYTICTRKRNNVNVHGLSVITWNINDFNKRNKKFQLDVETV